MYDVSAGLSDSDLQVNLDREKISESDLYRDIWRLTLDLCQQLFLDTKNPQQAPSRSHTSDLIYELRKLSLSLIEARLPTSRRSISGRQPSQPSQIDFLLPFNFSMSGCYHEGQDATPTMR